MKLAIVHDFLNQYGGAERCVEAFHEIYPDAPIYTSIYLPHKMPNSFRCMDIRTSFMQRLPGLVKHFKKYLPLYPKAIESFNLNSYDVILSSSSAFAKGARKRADALHVCYCYTPMRFVWNFDQYIEKENLHPVMRSALSLYLTGLKKWDVRRNKEVDHFVAISKAIQERIKRCYGIGSDMIYPPVNTGIFAPSQKHSDFFLVVSRLNAYKQIDIVIEACNALKIPLKIIGDGPHRPILEKIAGPTVEFLGHVTEEDLMRHYAECRAFIFPGLEDFGIVPLEAQSAGRPVIAFAAGGALETIIDGDTGIFFKEQTSQALIKAIERFEAVENGFNAAKIRENALRFDKEIFKDKIAKYVNEKYEGHTRS